MADKNKDVVNDFSKVPKVRKYWGWFLALGILLVILGVLEIAFANWTTVFSVIFLGSLLVAAGILQIISGLYAMKWSGFSVSMLVGILYIIAGCLCIFRPVQSAVNITLLMAVLLLVGGFFRLISAARYRFDYWGWVIFHGLVAILLGIFLLATWPISGLWAIGLFVGIDILLIGCYWIWLSLAVKK